VIGPGQAVRAHVVIEGLDESGAGPGVEVEVTAGQGIAYLADDVLSGPGGEPDRCRGEPSCEALGVEWAGWAAWAAGR
jgi:hypothetical protein